MSGPAFLDRYRACFDRTWQDETPLAQLRFVVLDSETTGLDPRTDRLITIGAVEKGRPTHSVVSQVRSAVNSRSLYKGSS